MVGCVARHVGPSTHPNISGRWHRLVKNPSSRGCGCLWLPSHPESMSRSRRQTDNGHRFCALPASQPPHPCDVCKFCEVELQKQQLSRGFRMQAPPSLRPWLNHHRKVRFHTRHLPPGFRACLVRPWGETENAKRLTTNVGCEQQQ